MPQQDPMQQTMTGILGRGMTFAEEAVYRRAFEERMAVETETAKIANEREKLTLEFEKNKNAAIAKSIELLMPRWERGGQPGQGENVDVGGFSQGGAPMQQTSVGPSGTSSFAQDKTRYQEPTQENRRQARALLSPFVQMPDDPEAIFANKVKLMEAEARIVGEERRIEEAARETAAGKKEEAARKRAEAKAAEQEAAAEKKETAGLKRDAYKAIATEMKSAQEKVNAQKAKLLSDVMFTNLPRAEQNARMAQIDDFAESWMHQIARNAKRSGIDIDPAEYITPKDPSIVTRARIDWYQDPANKSKRKLYDKWYMDTYGKSHGIKVKGD